MAGQAGERRLLVRMKGQIALLRHDADLRRTTVIDGLAQMSVAYFVVFAIRWRCASTRMSLQAAAGLITLQGALYVATLLVGGTLVARWRSEQRYLVAFVMLLAQSLLFGFGHSAAALWFGAALMGIGVGLQGVTSTTRFGELMQRHGRGRIGGLSSLAPTAGGIAGAVAGGVVSQHLGTEAGFRAARCRPCGDVRAAVAAAARITTQRGRRPRWLRIRGDGEAVFRRAEKRAMRTRVGRYRSLQCASMPSLFCAHCTRSIFLRPRQLPPVSGLCVPCDQRDATRRHSEQAWRKFRDRLLGSADAPRVEPLRPTVDLRHL